MIGSDGPRVNKNVFRIINEAVKVMPGREKGLLQVGTCNLHVINNAFLKGLETYGSDVSELILGLYYFFHGWPSRMEEYEQIQKEKKNSSAQIHKTFFNTMANVGRSSISCTGTVASCYIFFLTVLASTKKSKVP